MAEVPTVSSSHPFTSFGSLAPPDARSHPSVAWGMVEVEHDGEGCEEGLADEWEPVSDEELVALALGAGPADRPDPDAVSVDEFLGQPPGLLPAWYMPGRLSVSGSRRRRVVVLSVVATLLLLEALGLCSTFGGVVVG